jgi:hypothetical protein
VIRDPSSIVPRWIVKHVHPSRGFQNNQPQLQPPSSLPFPQPFTAFGEGRGARLAETAGLPRAWVDCGFVWLSTDSDVTYIQVGFPLEAVVMPGSDIVMPRAAMHLSLPAISI